MAGEYLDPSKWPSWMTGAMVQAPAPNRFPTNLYDSVRPMTDQAMATRSRGILGNLYDMVAPSRDQQGMPQAPGTMQALNAALMAMPAARGLIRPQTQISGPGAVFFSSKSETPTQFYYLARHPEMARDMVVKIEKGNLNAPTANNEVSWSFADQFKKYPDIWNDSAQFHGDGTGAFNRAPFAALSDVLKMDNELRQPASYVYTPALDATQTHNARHNIYQMMMRKYAPSWTLEPGNVPGSFRMVTGNDPAAGNFNYKFLADQKGSRDVSRILRALESNY